MKRSRYIFAIFAVALFLLSLGSVAKADGVDPKVGLGGSGSCSGPVGSDTNPYQQSSVTQVFLGVQTDCINDFQNVIGADTELGGMTINTLVVSILSPFDPIANPISCVLDPGSPLSAEPTQPAPNSCSFSNNGDQAGITPNSLYGLFFGKEFGATVDIALSDHVIPPVPEPGTLILLGTGLVALAANRKKAKTARSLLV